MDINQILSKERDLILKHINQKDYIITLLKNFKGIVL